MNPLLHHPSAARRRPGPGRRWLAGAALAVACVAGGIGAPIVAASAQEAAAASPHAASPGMAMPMSAADHARMAAHVQAMLARLDATPDQKTRIEADLQTAFHAMADMHAGMGAAHGGLHALLLAPTIDRDALERLRADHIARLDAASHKILDALTDAAETLRPEQRAKLAGMMKEMHPEK